MNDRQYFIKHLVQIEEQETRDYMQVNFVALKKRDCEIVGAGILYWWTDKPEHPEAILGSLYVDMLYREQGIGLALQLAREEYAKANIANLCQTVLWVNRSSWMFEWYKRRGYEEWKPYGKQENAVWMIKTI